MRDARARRAALLFAAALVLGCHGNQSPASAPTHPVPPSGQTTSIAPGDDASSAVASEGPRFTDNGDGTITDRLTGLMWERKCDNCASPHGVGDTYRWTSPAPDAVDKWLAQLNGENGKGYAGHGDWRLPTITELVGIVDYGRKPNGMAAAIDPAFGPTASYGAYWSSSPAAVPGGGQGHWTVGAGDGGTEADDDGSNHVRAVRGPASPKHAWRDNGDGTVTDLVTGLMWERKCSRCGGLHDIAETYAWEPSQGKTIWSWVADVNKEGGTGLGGHSDWRIPNIKELASLLNANGEKGGPVDGTAGPHTWYWSSTPAARQDNFAWTLNSDAAIAPVGRANALFVRAVRVPRPGEAPPKPVPPTLAAESHVMPDGCRLPPADALVALAGNRKSDPAAPRELKDACVVAGVKTAQFRRANQWHTVYSVALQRPLGGEPAVEVALAGALAGGESAAPPDPEEFQRLFAEPVRWEADPALADERSSRNVPLGYLYRADGTSLNAELVRRGFALADDDSHLAQHAALTAAAAEARRDGRGVAAPVTVSLQKGGGNGCEWQNSWMLTRPGGGIELLGLKVPNGPTLDSGPCSDLRGRLSGIHVRLDLDSSIGSEGSGYYADTTEGLFVNAELLRQGAARIDPEQIGRLTRATELIAAEREAREGGRGLWATTRVAGLETHQSCPLNLGLDGHERCHLLRFANGATVGLVGVRLPAWADHLHDEARKRAAEMVANTLPRQAFDPAETDPPGCELAYLTGADGKIVNVELVREGLARVDVGDLPLREADALRAAEQEARQAGRGIWGGDRVVRSSVGTGFVFLGLQSGKQVAGLTGVSIPNLGEGHDKAVSAILAGMVRDASLTLTSDPLLSNLGAHGGVYATFSDGRSLNVELVRQGLASVTAYGQPYGLEPELKQAEAEARAAGRGLWAAHDVLGASIRGGLAILVLRVGDPRYDPPNLTVQLIGVDTWAGHAQDTGTLVGKLTKDQKVHLGFDPALPRDPILTPAYVVLPDQTPLNVALIRQGVAKTDTRSSTLRLQLDQQLAAAQRAAQDGQQGMWSPNAAAAAAPPPPPPVAVVDEPRDRRQPAPARVPFEQRSGLADASMFSNLPHAPQNPPSGNAR